MFHLLYLNSPSSKSTKGFQAVTVTCYIAVRSLQRDKMISVTVLCKNSMWQPPSNNRTVPAPAPHFHVLSIGVLSVQASF